MKIAATAARRRPTVALRVLLPTIPRSEGLLMILDAARTAPPKDLPKFYFAVAEGHADLADGSRLACAAGKSTLCKTKVLFKRDDEEIARSRSYFGDFDPRRLRPAARRWSARSRSPTFRCGIRRGSTAPLTSAAIATG